MAKSMSNPFLDEAGEQVVHFTGDVRTLGKLGELRGKIIEMAESGAWRRYRTAVGVDEWLECEFDYFLISCDLEYDDVYRAIAHAKAGDVTRAMMDPDAGPDKRRTIEAAGLAWHAPVPETLTERAQRLGWTHDGSTTLKVAPVSDRQRAKSRHGKPWAFKVERTDPNASVDERARAVVERLGKEPELVRRVYQLLDADLRRQRSANRIDKPKTPTTSAKP